MSCQDCEEVQNSDLTAFYRWKNANIEINGCRKHLREIFDVLSEAQHGSSLTLCPHCNCMTKNVCGKCKEEK